MEQADLDAGEKKIYIISHRDLRGHLPGSERVMRIWIAKYSAPSVLDNCYTPTGHGLLILVSNYCLLAIWLLERGCHGAKPEHQLC